LAKQRGGCVCGIIEIMKVLNLQCMDQHVFEGWFASEEDFASQLARGLVECPLCGDRVIQKMLSAPRLNLGAGSKSEPVAAPTQEVIAGNPEQLLQAAWLQLARRILSDTEDVGERFAEEARKIHYGESAERGIRGKASAQQTAGLLEEGIEVMALPLPLSLKNPLH
jgi:hypothetical protein